MERNFDGNFPRHDEGDKINHPEDGGNVTAENMAEMRKGVRLDTCVGVECEMRRGKKRAGREECVMREKALS